MEGRFLLLFFGVLVAGGCVQEDTCSDIQESYEECHMVEVPYVEEVCESIPYAEQDCVNTKLQFTNITNRNISCLEERTKCIQFIQEGCGYGRCLEFEKTCYVYMETVSLELMNVDSERGTWSFNWVRKCRFNQPGCELNSSDVYLSNKFTLDPREIKRVSESIMYDRDAKETLSVEFTKTPVKKVCSNVTSYREACTNITVNRTVEECKTRNRTVEICE